MFLIKLKNIFFIFYLFLRKKTFWNNFFIFLKFIFIFLRKNYFKKIYFKKNIKFVLKFLGIKLNF